MEGNSCENKAPDIGMYALMVEVIAEQLMSICILKFWSEVFKYVENYTEDIYFLLKQWWSWGDGPGKQGSEWEMSNKRC